jgi:hypothetical protein
MTARSEIADTPARDVIEMQTNWKSFLFDELEKLSSAFNFSSTAQLNINKSIQEDISIAFPTKKSSVQLLE